MSIKELQRRYEGGTKQIRSVQKQIDDQLKRKCAYPECEESLAFRFKTAIACSEKHHRGLILLKRTKNREKKRRYYAKHGIVFSKTVRNRDAKPTAGLPALLPLPFGKQIMMSPDEYRKYKEGHGLTRHAINGRKRRAKARERQAV